jgi:hypothetical protein
MLCGIRISDHPASRGTLPAAERQATVWTLLRVLALTCLIVSMGAFAQSTTPIAPALSGTSARCVKPATSDTVSVDGSQVRCLTARAQTTSLATWIENHSLLSVTDAQMLSLTDAMKPEAIVEYARSAMVSADACEYRMFRPERVSGKWSERPDHMLIRYQDTPQKVYAK